MDFLNDEYTLDINDLGYKKQVDVIRELIIDADTPFSIGISGRWGSGKTSLMKYLMASLGGQPSKQRINFQTSILEREKEDKFKAIAMSYNSNNKNNGGNKGNSEKNIHAIWFNPWENESHQEPMVGLLQEIYNHFSFVTESKKNGTKNLSIGLQAGLNMLGSCLKLGSNLGTNIKDIKNKYNYDNFEYIDRNQKLKFIFQEAIKTLLTDYSNENELSAKARIVIFIDDLDRCEDDTVTNLLKEIKQYLSTKRCMFVFGYDRHHIEKSLSKMETKTSKETKAYLEKLFQATFYIKEPREEYLIKFVRTIVEKYKVIGDKITQNQKNSDEITQDQKNIDEFVSFIISIVAANPRRLKSYINAIYFHIKNTDSQPENLNDYKKLALIAYLKIFYESVYSALENEPKLLPSLLAAISNTNIFNVSGKTEYYFQLEFKNHLSAEKITSNIATDQTEDQFIDRIDYSQKFEEKFLSEVYEMQGKHRNFSKFLFEFYSHFNQEKELKKYL
jgi:ABC-type dipeptide/oligopeptide/nickel transport system ATPase component